MLVPAKDLAAEPPVHDGSPGNKGELIGVPDDGVFAGYEIRRPGEDAREALAFVLQCEGDVLARRHGLAGAFGLALFQTRNQVSRRCIYKCRSQPMRRRS